MRFLAPFPCSVLGVALLGAAPGCLGSSTTVFPPGLAPLGAIDTPWPGADGEYPEELTTTQGSTDDYDWVHARGYVHAPLPEVYSAMRVPEVGVDRREVDEWSVTWDVEEGYDHSYAILNVVHQIATIQFTTTWRHGVVEGTEEDAVLTATRWQKTDGSDVIYVMEGSMVATRVDDEVTSLELIEHLSSLQSDHGTIQAYLRDFHADLLAVVHDEPLQSFE